MFDACLNPALERQAVGRVHRMGQTRTVQIYKCVHLTLTRSKIWVWV
jgi:SNF2 family DNA or RNA helicase